MTIKQIFFLAALCAMQGAMAMEDDRDFLLALGAVPPADGMEFDLNSQLFRAIYADTTEITAKLDAINDLLRRGADVNARNQYEEPALMFACHPTLSGREDMCRLLIEKGADVNIQNDNGWTPLMFSVSMPQIVRQLLAAGADCNAATKDRGFTALMHAARSSNRLVCELLLQYGADPEMRNFVGKRAIDFARPGDIADLLSDPATIHAVILREDNPVLKKFRRFNPNICSALMLRELNPK
jgi:ankyrin repeat protein